VAVKIVASGVGAINESDIRLARSAGAIVYGFNVALPSQVKQLAARAKVEVRLYRVIYELLDDAKAEMSKLLPDEIVETPVGELEIKGIFRTTKDEIIAGGLVTRDKIVPHMFARIWRGKVPKLDSGKKAGAKKGGLVEANGSVATENDAALARGAVKQPLAEVEITSVQREKNEAKEVFEGEMCGVSLAIPRGGEFAWGGTSVKREKFALEVGDRLEVFAREMRKREL
jgi:translation initiation factor IF-2